MATIAFVVHPERPEAAAIAAQATAWIESGGHRVVQVRDTGPLDDTLPLEEGAELRGARRTYPEFDDTIDLAVSMGGDGTMLRTVALACTRGTPVLGVNLGRRGYLTEIEPEGLEAA